MAGPILPSPRFVEICRKIQRVYLKIEMHGIPARVRTHWRQELEKLVRWRFRNSFDEMLAEGATDLQGPTELRDPKHIVANVKHPSYALLSKAANKAAEE